MKCYFDKDKECPVVEKEKKSVFARLDSSMCIACQIKQLNNLVKQYLEGRK